MCLKQCSVTQCRFLSEQSKVVLSGPNKRASLVQTQAFSGSYFLRVLETPFLPDCNLFHVVPIGLQVAGGHNQPLEKQTDPT